MRQVTSILVHLVQGPARRFLKAAFDNRRLPPDRVRLRLVFVFILDLQVMPHLSW